jgi:phosphate acetyltransferase
VDIFRKLEDNAKRKKRTIILPESHDKRVIDAVKIILRKGTANVILIAGGKKINIPGHSNLDIIDIGFSSQFIGQYLKLRKKKIPSYSPALAEKELRDPLVFACMLLKNNFADAVVAGSVYPTSAVIKNALNIIGLSENNKTVSSFFLFTFPMKHRLHNDVFVFADCGVLPSPTAAQLSDIAVQTSTNYRRLTGLKPRTAFLSFSTKGSAKDESLDKVIAACKMTRKRAPQLICDGELQFDAAFVPEVGKRKNPNGAVQGNANVFIFPDLNSGNIAYKITERIGGAIATGPIVQGLAKPVMDLSRGCSAVDIFNMVLISAQF